MSNRGNTKKRRVEGGARVSIDGAGCSEGDSSAGLIAMKSTIDELVQQNRTQNKNMANMLQLMKSMQGEMKDMRGEITQLKEKCDNMESSACDRRIERKLGEMESGMHMKLNTNQMKLLGMDERLKYHEILLQNQQWKYSAPRPSYQYWAGINENARGHAEEFLDQIKKCTEEMRYGNSKGDIRIHSNHLQYNEDFLPHWKEFTNALEQYHHHLNHLVETKDDSKLVLWKIDLSDEVLDLFAKALKSTYFHRLSLDSNNFGQKGIKLALDYLEINDRLIEFGLVANPINSMKDIERLCTIIKNHPTMTVLTLNRCMGLYVNGYDVFKLILTNCMDKLQYLALSYNDIKTDGDNSNSISYFIRSNLRLGTLNLYGNKLNDNDALEIASSLKHNTTLAVLGLDDNNLTSIGWKVLGKAVFDKTSLNSAADSNHTCVIDFPENDSDFDELREINGTDNRHNPLNQNFDPILVRQKKIYTILSVRNKNSSNVDHFDEDMPVELLPEMLMSIQKYAVYHNADFRTNRSLPPRDTRDVKPLSIMFEILQRWDKSLAVFEALSSQRE